MVLSKPIRELCKSHYLNVDAVDEVRFLLAGLHHNGGHTEVRPTMGDPAEDETPLFINFIMVGLVPPFLNFFYAVMESYALRLLQIHPNSILVLSIFAHLCEMFIEVMSHVALFRRFYYPRITEPKEFLGASPSASAMIWPKNTLRGIGRPSGKNGTTSGATSLPVSPMPASRSPPRRLSTARTGWGRTGMSKSWPPPWRGSWLFGPGADSADGCYRFFVATDE